MAVFLAAAAMLAVYLANIPLKIAFIFHTRPRPELAAGASAFEGRFALRRARRRKKKGKRKDLPSMTLLRSALRAGRYLFPHVCFESFSARGVLSLPDAAATALATGLVRSLNAACAAVGARVELDLQPDFSASGSGAELQGMICIRAGHIILAALIFAQSYFKERFQIWTTGIPLKASCRRPWKISAT